MSCGGVVEGGQMSLEAQVGRSGKGEDGRMRTTSLEFKKFVARERSFCYSDFVIICKNRKFDLEECQMSLVNSVREPILEDQPI